MINDISFINLFEIAKSKYNPRRISSFVDAGSVSAAILTIDNNVYTGVCIDTASSLGMCAERNAIANMITNNESKIKKLVCYCGEEKIGSPCGVCREYLMQLDVNSGDIEILINMNPIKTIKLKELIPDWWGTSRMNTYLKK